MLNLLSELASNRTIGAGGMGKLTTQYLRAHDVDNLHEALLFADEQGYPLNLAITIKWSLFSGSLSGEQHLANAQERLRHSFKRRGHDLRWVWVREARNGAHHHLLAHDCFNDDGLTFERLLLRVLEPDGGPDADNAIVIKPTGTGQRGSGGPLGWWSYSPRDCIRTRRRAVVSAAARKVSSPAREPG
jgi:hypothetical protein